jgi:carbon monoxide dehydrogenase subunit G
MRLAGRYLVGAEREAVWRALNDTGVLAEAIPGCQRIEWLDASSLVLEIKVDLGLVQPVFTGELGLSDVVPADRYRLTGRGRGGLLGKAEAAADISLADAEGGTLLDFRASGGASGRIMALGQALIGRSAQSLVDGFFERFGRAMGADVTPVAAP